MMIREAFSRVKRWEIALFIVWWLAVLILSHLIGGVPLDKVEIDGMYRVTLKGPGPDRIISRELYWAWAIAAYSLVPYMIYVLLKYGRFFSLRR